MHILLGALVGGIVGVAATYATALLMGQKPTKGMLLGAFVSGAVAGAIASSTFGLSVVAGGGARALAFVAVEGALAGASGRVTENVVDDRPTFEGVAETAVASAIAAPVFHVAGRQLGKLATRVIPESVRGLPGRLASKVFGTRGPPDAPGISLGFRGVTRGTLEGLENASNGILRVLGATLAGRTTEPDPEPVPVSAP